MLSFTLRREGLFIEQFLVESWEEHERQHARTGKDEKAIHDAVFKCLKSGTKPVVRHFIHHKIKE